MTDLPPALDELRPWQLVSSTRGANLLVARHRIDRLRHPRSGVEFDRTVLEVPGWVNIVARTRPSDDHPAGQLVVVRQFRFGTGRMSVEIPGGVIDPGEEHRTAALRELREETGHTSDRWTYLGSVEPNPAFLTNVCHHWLAEDCEATHALDLDPGEDIAVELIDWPDVAARVHDGTLAHTLVVSALARVVDLRGGY
ncbi:MAG: NUDIX hydrolase [Planctomycetota bacterium]|nr:NUDIX hydrolase [Planctomycetota bacterium]